MNFTNASPNCNSQRKNVLSFKCERPERLVNAFLCKIALERNARKEDLKGLSLIRILCKNVDICRNNISNYNTILLCVLDVICTNLDIWFNFAIFYTCEYIISFRLNQN